MTGDVRDNGILSVYTDALIALSDTARAPARLAAPQASATATSPICGSSVTIDLNLNADGTIAGFGYASESCALTRAVIALMRDAVTGTKPADVARAEKALRAILSGENPTLPPRWAGMAQLAGVKDFPARHNALLLPFAALQQAANLALAAEKGIK